MTTGGTTVRVSKDTLEELERFQQALATSSMDQTIREILKLQRAAVISRMGGSMKGKLSPFSEEDRIDSDR